MTADDPSAARATAHEDGGVRRADAVVVAAGVSRRMGGHDKITARIGGRPLVAWSIDALAAAGSVDRIVLVVAPDSDLLRADPPWRPAGVAAIVGGGSRRQDSVAAGIRWLDAHPGAPGRETRVVLVHDGARPLVSPGLVDAVTDAAYEHGAAIPVLSVVETVKRIADGRVVETVDRSDLAAAQTPQGVRRDVLDRAWAAFPPGSGPEFTDEASLLEACNIEVHAIPGDAANLKVTRPADLERVASVLAPPIARVGIGRDVHPFGPGEPLRLGGIEIPLVPRLHGHSDGDVALHAVADALLGAAALGDLGGLFPADERTPAGVDSGELLAEVVRRLAAVGMTPATVDITIVAGRPRLAGHLPAMRARIANLLGVDGGAVGVKASSANLGGPEGAGRAIAAEAIVTVRPIPAQGGPAR